MVLICKGKIRWNLKQASYKRMSVRVLFFSYWILLKEPKTEQILSSSGETMSGIPDSVELGSASVRVSNEFTNTERTPDKYDLVCGYHVPCVAPLDGIASASSIIVHLSMLVPLPLTI
jgi:hypothetical protein